MLNIMQEKRPLKRPKLGPPDVYPQDAKQKEDELTATNVKQGFISMLSIQNSEEFGTARNCNVTASKVGAYFNAILARREELMTLPDSGRKKQQVNKDNFWPVVNRSRATLDIWFKDLAGNKPLTSLSKKAPSFNKKEDIFAYLCDNQVSLQKAAWFIKLNYAYTTAVSEAKIKKRQMPDPATEWTGTMIKFMKDLIPKLQEHYHHQNHHTQSDKSLNYSSNSSNNPMTVPQPLASPASNIHSPANASSTPSSNQQVGFTQDDYKTALKQWTYCTQLCKYMFEEGLLDRHEFLNWVLDLLDKMKSQPADDAILKIFLPLTMQYMTDFVQSERLSRRLAYMVCKKLSFMISSAQEAKENLSAMGNLIEATHSIKVEGGGGSNNNNNNDVMMNNASPVNQSDMNMNLPPTTTKSNLDHNLNEYLQCPHHRDLIIQLSAILQVITIECPTALVWCGLGETRASAALVGSPLDHLPIPPSALPIPNKCPSSVAELQAQLRQAEENIRRRSSHAEAKWCTDKWQNKNGNTSAIVLASLDALDSHCFDRMDTINNNNLEALYAKIFPPFVAVKQETGKGGELKETKIDYDPNKDAPTVKILLSWAVSSQRFGEHRAMAVAWLLDKRQSEVTASDTESSNADDKESIGSGGGMYGGVPVFQAILMNFLDKDAPVLEENGSIQNRSHFQNLVHLFSELIRHDVFSHDAYMCTLISRGDLLTGSSLSMKNATAISAGTGPVSNKTSPHQQNQGLDDDMFTGIDFKPKMEEFDDSNVDDDLDKILQNIKEDQQNAMDAPDSPKDSEQHHHSATHMSSDPPISRHFLYAKHFPLCQDDSVSQHDTNQRYILLFGVGKERDEKKHAVKKMAKEICKLFSKKFSIDVAEGGKVKKHSKSEFNFEATTNKCQSMSYFDQHVVTWQCAVTVQEMLNSFAMGNSNYLPVQEHVAFLFDLMEMALNIYGLIDMCIQILKELPEVESQLMVKNSILVKSYTTSLSLYVVGVLRRYHCCLLLSPDQTSAVFEGLCKVVKHVTNPGDCSSAERCILAYLFDLYSSCSLLKTKPQPTEPFHNAYPKIKQALYAQLTPVPTTQYSCKRDFMADVLANPRRGGKIEPAWGRQLNESAANRYSFVCNALIAVSQETDNDRLNDLSAMCAELTACCNSLSTEWLGALIALCGSSNEPFYQDILGKIDIQNNYRIHNSLAVFTCILVARHCFLLEKFVCHVALPPLVNACSGGREITPEAEAGARLSCHLLLRLFRTIEIPQPGLYSVSTSPNPITTPGPACNIKLSCDRHLLAAAHKNIDVGPVLAVLKGILVVGDATCLQKAPSTYSTGGKRSGLNTPVHPGSTPKSMSGPPIDLSHILGTSELGMLGDCDEPMMDLSHLTNSTQNENTSSLADFAQHVLRQICMQEWVLERCLQHADDLCLPGFLIDEMLVPKQAQRLLHMICYPENESNIKSEMDQKSIIVRILENLEQWSLRISWVDLQLMFKQTNTNSSSPSPELNHWLDTVARAAIDVFHVKPNQYKQDKSMWLVAPLVSKLHSSVQGRILRVAGNVLESTNFFTSAKKIKEETNEDSNGSNDGMEKMEKMQAPQMSHQAFLGLILTCLKGQDEQKEGLLSSLHTQLSQFLQSSNELDAVGGIELPQGREQMLDALQLRFSLVGGMFDAIQKNATATTDWAILLAQLISQGIIDLSTNSELFTTVLDMLATLIHSTLISDSQSERDENKKIYINLMKKLKKELGDRNNPSVRFVRQLLPLSKQTCEVIACESAGCLTDTKGNKISGFDSIDKKPGLKLSDKQRVNVWDFLEGHKNPAPLSWAWFGAVKMERRPLAYEETHRLLKYHTHSLVKPSSYYYEPLPLPPEDLEPLPEKPKEEKADTPSSVDQSPGTILSGRGRGKGVKRPKKQKGAAAVPINQQTMPNMQAQQQLQQQQQQQQQQQMQQNNPMHMQMNMQSQMNPNMQQQFQQANQMQNQMQNPNAMMNQVPGGGMGGVMGAQGQQGGMGFVPPGGGVGGVGVGQMGGQQQQQWPQGFNPMQQQQQQFYNQGMQPQMNRFERPQQINNQSKQALSIMLRQRHPPGPGFMPSNQAVNPNQQSQQQFANMQQQQQRNQQLQHQQSQQHQQYIRSSLRGMNPAQMGTNQMVAGMQPGMGPGVNPNSMMGGQVPNQMAQSQQLAQSQQPGIMGQSGGGGAMMQTGRITPASMGQGNGMIGQAGGGGGNIPGMIPQANRTMAPTTGMMPQQAAGMVPQVMNSAGVPGIQQQGVVQQGGQQAMFPGAQQQQQFGGMGQNFGGGVGGGGYGNQGMPQQPNLQQNMQMGNFNQINAQRSQAEFLAQQRSMQQQQQQANQQQQQVQASRGQFAQQVPNVTMNQQGMNQQGMSSGMVGQQQQQAPPYPRQQPSGATPQQQQLFQQQQQQSQQQQQQRMRQQQQLLMQQQQLGMAQQGGQGMQPNQGQQGMVSQQTPALVAQLQRQMPNQQPGGMMNQQYNQQPY